MQAPSCAENAEPLMQASSASASKLMSAINFRRPLFSYFCNFSVSIRISNRCSIAAGVVGQKRTAILPHVDQASAPDFSTIFRTLRRFSKPSCAAAAHCRLPAVARALLASRKAYLRIRAHEILPQLDLGPRSSSMNSKPLAGPAERVRWHGFQRISRSATTAHADRQRLAAGRSPVHGQRRAE